MRKILYYFLRVLGMLSLLFLLFSIDATAQDLTEAQRLERCQNNKNRIAELIPQLRDIETQLAQTMSTKEIDKHREQLALVRKFKQASSWDPIAVQRIAANYNFNMDECITKNYKNHYPTSSFCLKELENIIVKKIDIALSLENKRPYLLGKKTELGKQLTEHQNNLIALGCNQVSGTEGAGSCFSSDPAMASTNRDDHYNWAQTQNGSQLEANMKSKINILNNCPSVNDDAFAATFAALSAIIAKYAQKIAAFNNDIGASNTDPSAHYNWAKNQPREQLLQNLQWKTEAAFKGLNSTEQKIIFADMSVQIAQGSQANRTSGSNANNTGRNNNNGLNTQADEWKVWVKASPCSGRFDWITVAKDNPTGGGNFFYPANEIFPGTTCTTDGCTFATANAVAATLRTSSKFSNYCCQDYSVWKNNQTGKTSVVLGKFGSPGFGWGLVKGTLCCEEAEALAGIPGACSGTTDNNQQTIINNTKCWPGSHAAWNAQTKKIECYCNTGLVWNSTKTACVDPKELVKNADCSAYPGSYAGWNEELQKVECYCPEGKIWNSTMTACIDDPAKVKCWPGSYAAVNPQTNKTECYCNQGLVWNSTKTACVDPQELVKNADCSKYPGSYAGWNKELQKVECYCPDGKIWNSTMTACIDDPAKVNCWPGSYAALNPQTNKTECYCNPGLVWNSTKTACVDPQELVKNADCSKYAGSYAAWNAQTQKVECRCPDGKIWNSTMTACIDAKPSLPGGGGTGSWTLVSVTVSPEDPNKVWGNHEWTYSGQSPSAHYSIYNGAFQVDYNWTPPPQQFNSNGFTVSLNVKGTATGGQAISGIISVSTSGVASDTQGDQSAYAAGTGSASAQKSLTFKPTNSSDVEVKVSLGWGSVTYTYKYRRT
jgi:hypothetical protein